ncbi:Ig-like domain-containing protein, partial [Mycobacterium adipatum]|uniref:tandem-95 repeat protein n=1 Tax=Mycobacterium adipatum TaxID=1682113 RepID=UPI0034E06F8A
MASSARRRDAGRNRARHHKHKNPVRAQATYPTFRLDAQAATSTADNGSYGRYIGRVGGLAVALGVGAALTTGLGAGIAHAGPSTKNTTHDSSPTTPRTKSPKTAKTAPRTATRPAAPTSDGPPDAVDETGPDATETPTQADVDATVATPASTADTSALTAAPPSSEPNRAYSDVSAPAAPDTSVLPTGSTPSAAISLPSPTDDTAPAPQTLGTDFGINSSPAAGAGTPSAASLAPIAAAPSAKTSVMQVFVSTLLSPFLAPGPAAPCQPPLMWAMLASVVREFQRTFFNRSPVVLPQEVTLVLEPDGTSSPTAFNGHDGDGDKLTYIVPARGVPGGPSHGWVTVDELTGTFTYTRDGNYTGPDQFTVTASDAGNGFHMHGLLGFLRPAWGHTDTTTITIDVVAAETPPTVNNDFFTTPEDIPVLGSVLSNDSDPNDQTLTTTLLSEPSNGSVTLEQNGVFNYTPNPDWNGVDGFTYRASNRMASASASVSIVVTPVNKAPQTSDDLYTTTEDTAISGNVLNNDTDPDGDAITAGLVMPASHGNVQLNADGSFSYTPATNFHGTDGFSYVASDGSLSSAPTLVTITVTPVNDAPVAQNDNYVVNEDSILTGSVLPNDTDADGDSLAVSLGVGPAHGSLTLNPNGSFSYIPAANYNGTDSFTYTVTDGAATSNSATATITVNAVNDTPVASDASINVNEDASYTGTVSVIDVDGDSVTSEVVNGPAHGSLVFDGSGAFVYTPAANYAGTDSFTYTATDGVGTSSVARVSITVTPVNDTPVAVNDTFTANEDSILTGSVLSNDTDVDGNTLTATTVIGPSHGTLVLNADGSFSYTPDADYAGADSFAYVADDGTATSSVATVSITISPVNDAPVAGDDIFSINEDSSLTGNLLANDSDVDGDSLTASLTEGPGNGTLEFNSDGTFTYTPSANFNGVDWFTYTVSDGVLSSAPALVVVLVDPVNDVPVAGNDSYTVNEDSTLAGNVLSNDSDAESLSLTATLVSGPTHGTLTLYPNGSFTYTPAPNYKGTDSFTYTASDGTAISSVAVVSISVAPDNKVPVANADSYTGNEDSALAGNVLANDTDADGNTLTATLISGPAHGSLELHADGTFTYTPVLNYNGADSFTYTASDGTATSSVATVSITVSAVNDTPVAVGDAASTDEDTVLTGNVLSNDSDVDGNTLTASLVDGPANGTLTLNPDGSFTYTPDADFDGADSFTYTATDGTATSSVATVSITVNPVNDSPVTVDDTVSTNEDTALTGNVLTNDTDVDGDTLTATLVDGPTNGTLTLNPDGSFTYTPDADFDGTDSFTYTATDGTATSSVATVSITVDPVNDTPIAVGDSFSMDEDTVLTGNVLSNDSDVDGDTLTATLVDGTTNGTLTLNADGSFTYTPDADSNGADSFTYTAGDGTATSSVATVSITVNPVNDTPVTVDDTLSTNEDTVLTGNVLTNDTDNDADTLTATLVDGPTNGTLTLNPDGSFTYTPDADFNGADSFTYTASDGTATSSVATVSITVDPVNDSPVTVGDTVSTNEDTVLTGNVLTNDTDSDGDTLTVTLVDGPTNGSLTLNPDGSFTYTPDTDFNGTDSFTYTATDGTATSSVATVSITVDPVNDTPIAVGDSFSMDEDTVLTGNVLSNDSDVDGDTLTATLVDGTTNGTLTLNADGSFTYTPDADFNGADSFTYTAGDGTSTSSVATVSITVNPVNDTPATTDNSFSTDEDTPLSGNVLTNDSDVDGDTLTATLVDGPTNGTLTLNADGTFTYTPDTDFNGSDSFTYTATDGTATSSVATVSITVNPVNDAPVTVDDSVSTNEDTVLTGNVLTNDSDTDGDTLTATLVDGPANGTLTLNPDGSFTYTPDTDFNGADSFTYTASDGTSTSSVATVSITVNPVNDTPVTVADSFTTDEDTALTGNVLSNDSDSDGDTLTATLVDGPANGTLTLNPDGSFTYTPDTDFNGTDSFTYTATDGTATSSVATVSITINPVNDTPATVNDTLSTNEDTVLTGNVLSNDSDVDGDTLTATLVDGPTNGTLTLNPDGSFTYTPDTDFNGADSFTYTAGDGTTTSSVATVSITVNPVNDAPVAVGDAVSTDEDTILTGNVLTNDTDNDADTLTATLVDGPTRGTLTLNPDGSFTYTPDTNFNGTDSFTYTAGDGTATSSIATVSITVDPINDTPVAVGDTVSTDEDTVLTGNVLSNDTDNDADTLTATLVDGPTNGTLTLNPDGSFTYTPDTNFNGADSFTYTATDGTATSSVATVTITVNPVNDAPVAVGDAVSTDEDTPLTGNVLTNDLDADGDTLTATLVDGPTNGTLALNPDGTFTYTPDTNFNGTDSFTYTATDGTATSSVATVSITVNPVNDAPVAVSDAVSTDEDTVLTGNVLTNDSDTDGDTLTATLVDGPTNGTLTLNPDGSFTYTPDTDFNGFDSFTYTATDSTTTSPVATVSITVNPVNDTPVTAGDTVSTDEDTVLTGNVLTNDSDVDGDTLTVTLVDGPANGTLTLNPDGSFTYTPDTNFNGADSFTYTASDGTATGSIATVSITVNAVNDTPVAVGDTVSTDEDTVLTGNVLNNDSDVDGDTLTATLVDGPTSGTLTLNADGSFTYTPDADFNGADSFTYTAGDGTATSSVATVSITVNPINDTPVTVNDSSSTAEDTTLTGNVLSNDSDNDGDTLTATLVDGPTNGAVTLNADGSFTYTPDTNFNGTDSFTYTASDGTSTSSVATVSITVNPINDAPVAVGDAVSTNEDTVLTGNVLTNDTDNDADTLTATLVDGPANGTLTLNPDGSFTYTPDTNFNGADSFTYTATDGTSTSSVATVSITVNPVNDTPVTVNDTVSTNEDTTLTGNVLTNDTDNDADTLTATLVDGPTNGTLTLNADGSFTYTPGTDFNGADSFTYTATDGTATSSVATVSITIDPVNDAPVAVGDTVSTDEDTPLSGNVLTNDSDIDADTLTATLVDGPTNGTLTLNPDGSFTYTPDADFNGADSFTYTTGDGAATSSVATVSITVNPVNDAPVAVGDAVSTDEDTPLSGNVLTNDTDVDGDTLTATLVDGPTNGTLTLNADGSFTYTPDSNFNGADSFTYTAGDGTTTSSVATVSITIDPVNDAPVAVGDTVSTDEDTPLSGNVLSNDSDIDADTLTATLVDGPTNGTLTLNADGSFTYTPDSNFNGADSFTYTTGDGAATSSVATVSITVNPVNDAPVAVGDAVSTDEDTPLSGNVLTNDTDVDGDTLTATLVDGPTNGTLTLNPDGSFTYTPDTNFNGTDSFTYTATDGTATSSVATVSITVAPVNDTPITVSDSFSTDEDTPLSGNVLTNDTDVDGDTLTATLVDGPTNGTLTLNPDGSFTYTPDANYNGADSFTYTASDGTATSPVSTVTITIDPVNDAPVAVNDSFSTNEDTVLTGNVLSNDSDTDGDTLTATLVNGPTNGTLTLNADGSFTYTPDADFNGADSFTYTATDGTATSDTATVSITVNPVNDAPVAVDDSFSTDEDSILTGTVLSNDTDTESDTLTATLVDGPTNGTLTLNADGTFTYTP